jgi:hypothetical protein
MRVGLWLCKSDALVHRQEGKGKSASLLPNFCLRPEPQGQLGNVHKA